MATSLGLKERLGLIIYITAFLVLEIVFGYYLLESHSLFVESTIRDGSYLAQTQVEKIESRMNDYAFAVTLAGKYLDEMVDANISDAEIEKWMKSYCDKVSDRFGGNVLDLYAVLDGKIVAANPWEGDDSYDYAAKSWYSDAVAATPGTIVFSDLYRDAITGQNVFTMSHELSDADNVVAIDVYITSENWMDFSELPDGYGLLVYDPHLTLAYSIGDTHLISLQEDMMNDDSGQVMHYVGDAKENYNIYVSKLSSGWSVGVAIPDENVVFQNRMFLMNLGLGLNVLNIVIVMVFLTQNIRNSKQLRQDTLTGISNRSYIMKQMRNRLKRSNGTLLLIDLDNFKEVNDNYGHDNGDLVLMRVAEVLQSCFRKSDCIGRLGGDEFVIYVDASFADDVLDSKLQEVIYQVVELARRYPMSNLSVSIGGCRCKKGDKYSEVFKHADEALYQVKKSGKCGFAMSAYK